LKEPRRDAELAVPAFTVIAAEPLFDEASVAVKILNPAKYRVADNEVVLTPLVKETVVGG
jgi:hypothetical protein